MSTLYKVVAPTDIKDIYSSVSFAVDYRVFYELKKYTYPKIGKLFCFRDLNIAKNFMMTGEFILKCEYSGKEYFTKTTASLSVDGLIADFWKARKQHKKYPRSTVTVDGHPNIKNFVLVDWVFPIEVVYKASEKETLK